MNQWHLRPRRRLSTHASPTVLRIAKTVTHPKKTLASYESLSSGGAVRAHLSTRNGAAHMQQGFMALHGLRSDRLCTL
jgi:hypothetical protein